MTDPQGKSVITWGQETWPGEWQRAPWRRRSIIWGKFIHSLKCCFIESPSALGFDVISHRNLTANPGSKPANCVSLRKSPNLHASVGSCAKLRYQYLPWRAYTVKQGKDYYEAPSKGQSRHTVLHECSPSLPEGLFFFLWESRKGRRRQGLGKVDVRCGCERAVARNGAKNHFSEALRALCGFLHSEAAGGP